MGVHGLWRLIEPSGKPVPFETLENKVLAVDISLWLHQAVKGFQDSKGAPLPNAHLLGIYHRLCKLLYFRIKPVFVFDGGVPELKRQTIAKRKQSKAKCANRADEIQKELLQTILKHTAVSKVLEEKLMIPEKIVNPKKKNDRDMYALDNLEISADLESTLSNSDDDSSYTEGDSSSPSKYGDLHNVDLESDKFKSLPVDVRHEILIDLKETRKQSSWGRIHQIPKVSHEFSSYQMQRLLKRQSVQSALEQAEKEMGGKTLSLAELEFMLKDQGIITDDSLGRKIASDEHAKYLLVKANQETETKKLQSIPDELSEGENSQKSKSSSSRVENADSVIDNDYSNQNIEFKGGVDEFEEDLQKAIALSLQDEPSTSTEILRKPNNCQDPSFLENLDNADFMSSSSEEDFEESNLIKNKTMSTAAHYMIEYSGLTPAEISKILESKTANSKTESYCHKSKKIAGTAAAISDREETLEKDGKNEQTSTETGSKNTRNDTHGDNKINDDESNPSIDVVDIMSSSSDDSSDLVDVDPSEVTLPRNRNNKLSNDNANMLQVSVDIESQFDKQDDLFSDIFGSPENEKSKEILATIDSDEEPEKNNSFSDVFSANNSNVDQNILIDSPSQNTLEIAPKPDELAKNNKAKQVDENYCEPISEDIAQIITTSNESRLANVPLPDDSIEIINNLQKANKTGSLNKQLTELKDKLQHETSELLNEKGHKQRMAENITDQMYQEAQDLLELFGVPYIIAPMEAEAQCAFLDAVELTNGTITDDSDIWLFGGRTVYKNFFNQNKYVMEFKAENIEHHFKLSREQMILLALLVGSDYTNGLQGVGPVTALEILAAFPPNKLKQTDLRQLVSGLREFRSWFTKGKSLGLGRTALKKKLKNVTFTENFPSTQVVEAYLDPKVETSRDLFSWGTPNFEALIEFAKDKFGWTRLKSEQIVNPVLQRFKEGRVQRSIKDYFKMTFNVTDSDKIQDQMSKRVRYAVENMGRDPNQRIADEFAEEISKELKKKLVKRKTDKNTANEEVKFKRSRQKNHKESEVLSSTEVHDKNAVPEDQASLKCIKTKNTNDQNRVDNTTENYTITRKDVSSEKGETINRPQRAKKAKPTKTTFDISQAVLPEDKSNMELTDTAENIKGEKKPKRANVTETEDVNSEKTKGLRKSKRTRNDKRTESISSISQKVVQEDNTNLGINDTAGNDREEKKAQVIKLKTSYEEDRLSESESTNSENEISNKIALIRQRRSNKVLKIHLEKQSAKLDKRKTEKRKDAVDVPEELKEDEDVNILVQTAIISGAKVENIYKQAQEELDNLQATTSKNVPTSSLKAFKSVKRPARSSESTTSKAAPRIPRKDVLPQKKQDQATILRNKMKAIEVFRKSKKGPGYVCKKERKRQLPKDDAGLSESD